MYGEALTLNGEHYLAERVLEGLTSSSGGVLRARARLRAAQGAWDGARALLRTAQMYELPRSEVDLHLVQLRVDEGTADGRSLGTLESIASAASTPPRQQALALLLAATVQQAQGRIDRARASLSRAITIRKIPDPELSYRAGLLFLKLHDLENARREATEGVRLSPRNPRLADLMARIDVALDRPADAVALLTRWGEPAGASARLTLAEAYLRLEQPTRAAAALAKVSEPSIRRRFLSARIQLALGKPYLALRELRDLGADQTAAEAQRIRGLAALSLGDAQQAVATFQAALALDPLDAEALVSLARIARDRGDAKESQAYLARAVRSSPHLRQARLELAQLLLRLGEFGAARTQLDETLALEGSNRAALLGRARVAVELDSKDADFFLRALQVQGHGEATALLSARRHMVRGEWQAAADRLTELTLGKRLARDPDTLLWLGMALQKIGDVETAALTYERVLAASSKSVEAHLGLSEITLEAGDGEAALSHGQAALRDLASGAHPMPLRIAVKLQLARCHRRAGATGAAMADLEDILELVPEHVAAHLELGRIYASLDQRARAAQHLAAALAANRENPEARRELEKVCRGAPSQRSGCPL
jgi:tetratricopeptide (TPR) repeat protein